MEGNAIEACTNLYITTSISLSYSGFIIQKGNENRNRNISCPLIVYSIMFQYKTRTLITFQILYQ